MAKTPSDAISVKLEAADRDRDSFTFKLGTNVSNSFVKTVSIRQDGTLVMEQLCFNCTGEFTVPLVLVDVRGAQSNYILRVRMRDRMGPLNASLEGRRPPNSALLKWHIFLIILGMMTSLSVVTCVVLHICCTFTPDLYDITPPKKHNSVGPSPSKPAFDQAMNPFARPKKMSIIVREAVRSGAADGMPYYGQRRSGLWIPTLPSNDETLDTHTEGKQYRTGDGQSLGESSDVVHELPTHFSHKQPRLSRCLSNALPLTNEGQAPQSAQDRVSLSAVVPGDSTGQRNQTEETPPTKPFRRLSQDTAEFRNLPWADIMKPRTSH